MNSLPTPEPYVPSAADQQRLWFAEFLLRHAAGLEAQAAQLCAVAEQIRERMIAITTPKERAALSAGKSE